MKKKPIARMLLITGLVFAGGCSIGSDDNVRLGVPYHAQETNNYCVPASIQMWADYDGVNPLPTQTEIWNFVGQAPCDAVDATYGVQNFTITGGDAYLDIVLNPSELEKDQVLSRQITSIDSGIPVLAVISPFRNHVGIINGGNYTPVEGGWRWDTVLVHDPDPGEGPNDPYSATDWLLHFCDQGDQSCIQVISEGATAGWYSNYSNYHDEVYMYGSITEKFQQ